MASTFAALGIFIGLLAIFRAMDAAYFEVKDSGDVDQFYKYVRKYGAVLVKFDVPGDSGKRKNEFTNLVKLAFVHKDIAIVEAVIDESGEVVDMAERFGVMEVDCPVYQLFIKGKIQPFTYDGNMESAAEIKDYIKEKSGLWLTMKGCLEKFDKLAQRFMEASRAGKVRIMAETEAAVADLINRAEKTSGNAYVRIMRKILENDDSVLSAVIVRLHHLLEQALSQSKKTQTANTLNILKLFDMHITDEL